MKIGVLIAYNRQTDLLASFQKAADMGLECCQICIWDVSLHSDALAERILQASAQTGISVSALWAGWSGPCEWNFAAGPLTLGLVPPAYRAGRLKELFAASDFAEKIQVTDVITHCGYIPENPNDPDYLGVVVALRSLASHMKRKGQFFLFETGQETPVTLLRAIEDIGTGNLGINFDMANLVLYGKANPADALDIIGKYVRNLHCKDGEYPTDGRNLGHEKKLGDGRVNLPLILEKLKKLGYDGALTIEREISGEEQTRDILHARDLLRSLLNGNER
jgi:L-ribulose-5-phosphate 3-epimerase